MVDDTDRNQKPADLTEDEDKVRTREARRVLEDYVAQLREMLQKFRKWLH